VNDLNTTDSAFEYDLRQILSERGDLSAPASLFAVARTLAPDRTGTSRRFQSIAFGLTGIAAVVFISGALVVSYFGHPLGAGSGKPAFDWQTQVATLEANSLTVHASNADFVAPADANLHSDPGTPSYRTLEMSWNAGAVPMNLSIYLAADDMNWWVAEIRTYDGRSPGEWLHYQAPQIRAALGESYVGNLDVSSGAGAVSGRLTIDGMRLTAFAPGTGISWQPNCHLLPAPNGSSASSAANTQSPPDLTPYGISLGTSAPAADRALSAAGVCHDFRLEYSVGGGGGFSQIWCTPPDGDVSEAALGSEGQVILFVKAAPDATLSTAQLVGCN
jgi:hypothetical protein